MKIFRYILSFILVIGFLSVKADQIDIGIFESATNPGQIDIKIRPDFDIAPPQMVTALLYTIRWDDPDISLSTQYISPFNLAPQGDPEEYNGYFYQVFAAVPSSSIPMSAGEEYIVSSFTFTNGECASFEIIVDEWSQANNGNLYLEFFGADVTGIIYQPLYSFGSVGGELTGGTSVFLGNSTGPMALSGHQGAVLTWQRKINEDPWSDIPGTAGLTSYSETPATLGTYTYRCQVQFESCPSVFSQVLTVAVLEPVHIELSLKVFLEGGFVENEMHTLLNQQDLIPLSQPYSGVPWKYNGTESVALIPNLEVVDWVLVELRETAGGPSTATSDKRIGRQAGLLLKNGTITGTDGISNLLFELDPIDNVYVIIWHRNHLAIMSSAPLTQNGNILEYDFTTSSGQAYLEGQKELAENLYGMYAGNASGDGEINSNDKTRWSLSAARSGYFFGDMDLNGQLNNQDKNEYWLPNLGITDKVPD